MNSINPPRRSREFSQEAWEADLERPTFIPPAIEAITKERELIDRLLNDPELMHVIEMAAMDAHKLGVRIRKVLENWEEVQKMKEGGGHYWNLRK